jgi:hypothetical protein
MIINKTEIHKKFNGHCSYCGKEISIKEMQIDHIQPRIFGGTNNLDNLNPSCRPCNLYKSNCNLEEFRKFLSDLFTIDYRLFKSKNKRDVAINFKILTINNWNCKFYFEQIESK